MVVFLLLAASAAPSARSHHPPLSHEPAAAREISFELSNGRIFVPVFVNGKGPYRFGLDTGASGIGRADSRLTAEQSLPRAGEAANSDGIQTTSSQLVSIRSLRLGDLERLNSEVISRDYNRNLKPSDPPMMGILGREFFAGRLLVIDYPKRRLRFANGALPRTGKGVTNYKDGFAVPVCFAAACYPGKVDTGSNRSLVLPENVFTAVKRSAPNVVGQVTRTNSSAQLFEFMLLEPVRISGVTAHQQKVYYAHPSTDTINVGSEFLKDYVLTIDQANHRLRIAKP